MDLLLNPSKEIKVYRWIIFISHLANLRLSTSDPYPIGISIYYGKGSFDKKTLYNDTIIVLLYNNK